MEPGVGRGAPATPPGARAALPVNGLLPVPARGVRVGVFPENGLLPGRGPAGLGAGAAGASEEVSAEGAAAAADVGTSAGTTGAAGAGAAAAAAGAGAAGAGAGAATGAAGAGAGAAGAGAGTAAATGATAAAGAAAAGAAAAGAAAAADSGFGVWVGEGARRTLDDDDVRRGAPDVGVESAPRDARNLRATGASTVDDAERANSPMSLSFSRTCLLSSPSSLASS